MDVASLLQSYLNVGASRSCGFKRVFREKAPFCFLEGVDSIRLGSRDDTIRNPSVVRCHSAISPGDFRQNHQMRPLTLEILFHADEGDGSGL